MIKMEEEEDADREEDEGGSKRSQNGVINEDDYLPDLSFLSPEDEEFIPEISENCDSRFFCTSDFTDVIKCIVLLQKQRLSIIEERDQLLAEREVAMKDPASYIENALNSKKSSILSLSSLLLSSGGMTSVPTVSNISGASGTFKIAECPVIDFQKYEMLNDKDGPKKRKRRSGISQRSKSTSSQSHGILWSLDEQSKLEELLIKYPDEPVASHRWEKIARELGNRTPKQVASRVQKYFIKLAKAGLPVPGKLPNMEYYVKRKKVRTTSEPITKDKVTIHTSDIAYYAPPPIPIHLSTPSSVTNKSEEDKNEGSTRSTVESSGGINLIGPVGDSSVPMNANEKIVEVIHEGYKCSLCSQFPIRGPRWTCTVCPSHPPNSNENSNTKRKQPVKTNCWSGVHLCGKCMEVGYKKPPHRGTHEMKQVYQPTNSSNTYFDEDEYNYLDPNFMPL